MTVSAEVVENRRRWIERLESGQDLQCRSVLNEMTDDEHVGGFCCLGVACDVIAPDAWISGMHLGAPIRSMPRRRDSGASSWLDSADGIRVSTVMPDFVAEAMGMPHANAAVGGMSQQTLASMNDNGKSFSEIAAHLRKWFGPDLDKELV